MNNKFTVEDIKNSVEYQSRKRSLKGCIVAGGICIVFVSFRLFIENDVDLQSWLICIAICSAIWLSLVVSYCYKIFYLLKHYEEFNSYEVILDNISSVYRNAVRYTVTIVDEGVTRQVTADPSFFSSGIFAKFTIEDYNQKKVVGLYDSQKDKFYIIKKV